MSRRGLTPKERECPYCKKYIPERSSDAHLDGCRREAKRAVLASRLQASPQTA